jgi:osmoprotectant transport system permease protein
MRALLTLVLVALASVASASEAQAQGAPVIVASKPFGESYLLAEMFAQLLESRGISVIRRPGLGATEVAFAALGRDAIDVYPEYTGTGLVAILHDSLPEQTSRDARAVFAYVSRQFSERYHVRWLPPLGFENTYAIAIRRETSDRYHIRTLSDLARESQHLSAGLTADFIGRPDGLVGLERTYGIKPRVIRPLAPALKYQALATGAVDFIDGYSTDGLLAKYSLVVLQDDRNFFPPYQAAAVIGPQLARERADAVAALSALSGQLDEQTMRQLNRRVEVDRESVAAVAADALASIGLVGSPRDRSAFGTERKPAVGLASYLASRRALIAQQAVRHVLLVVIALLAAIVVAVPFGLFLERARGAAEGVLRGLGAIQTIPSIALLAFMIPLFGVGVIPALVALWLYCLYPIARGTYTGVREADPEAVAAAMALGATPRQLLMWIRLPLATPVIMSGVRTAAVITVGAATLAAFIGAGGLGEPIVEGLALADTRLILSGAIPAALLALIVDALLAEIERRLRPAHMRGRFSKEPSAA